MGSKICWKFGRIGKELPEYGLGGGNLGDRMWEGNLKIGRTHLITRPWGEIGGGGGTGVSPKLLYRTNDRFQHRKQRTSAGAEEKTGRKSRNKMQKKQKALRGRTYTESRSMAQRTIGGESNNMQ